MGIKVFTDAGSNLYESILKEKNLDVVVLPMPLKIKDKEYLCYENIANAEELSKSIYLEMEQGAIPHTSLPNPGLFASRAREEVKKGNKVISICLSSGVSGTFASNRLIAQEINDECKEEMVKVIDSKTAGFGEGMVVIYCYSLIQQGLPFEEVVKKTEEYIFKVRSEFTVNSIKYLANTGRVSFFKAKIADAFNIKPLLYGNSDGKIVSFSNVRGRKNALNKLADHVKENITNLDSHVYITHCNSIVDAKYFESVLNTKGIQHTEIHYFDLVTGAHVGPGTIAVFYEGNNRDINHKGVIQSLLRKKSQ